MLLKYPYDNFLIRYNKAVAFIKGGNLAPKLYGTVCFVDVPLGVMVYVYVKNLPEYAPSSQFKPPIGPFGFHLHEKGCCDIDNLEKPFTCAGGHFNPDNQPHGNHAGDFPPLFSNDGVCIMSFFTNRFKVKDIINQAVIIHENPDDFKSQPSGNAGRRIACGIVKPLLNSRM